LRKARSRRACRRWKFRAANSKPAPACWAVREGGPRRIERRGAAPDQGRRLRVNDAAVTDEKMVLTPSNLTPEGVIKLSMGKKKHVLLKPLTPHRRIRF
jgi:tyrosyl-tRNA synthetase